MISFEVTREDADKIEKIVDRAAQIAKRNGKKIDKLDLTMDITATHANGTALDLNRLLQAEDFNFTHDVFGIMRYLDRNTGQLQDYFRPRFTK